MDKTFVTPEDYTELVNQAIKRHPLYSEETPIVINKITQRGQEISIHPDISLEDKQTILEDAFNSVAAYYPYK